MESVYLDPNNYRTTELMDILVCNAQIKAELDLIEGLKPIFSKDGNQ